MKFKMLSKYLLDSKERWIAASLLLNYGSAFNPHVSMLSRQAQMAKRYISEDHLSDVFILQEIARIESANSNGDVKSGKASINIMSALLSEYCQIMGESSGSMKDFIAFANENIASAVAKLIRDPKCNVRYEVKQIFMWPHLKYLPWKDYTNEIPIERMENIKKYASQIAFKLELVDDKVYAVPSYSQNQQTKSLAEFTYDEIGYLFNDLNLNSESCHITVINSDRVSKIGKLAVKEFIEQLGEFTIEIEGSVLATFSEDWPLFGGCAVVKIRSPFIANFLEDFNREFAEQLEGKIGMIPHITFATASRIIN